MLPRYHVKMALDLVAGKQQFTLLISLGLRCYNVYLGVQSEDLSIFMK